MEQMITNLGFPIACVVAMGGCVAFVGKYLLERDKQNREDTNKLIENLREDNRIDRDVYRETIDKFDNKLDKFAIALENNNSKLGAIEHDVKNIKEKVGV